jgi:type IV pilus biogenesis protein CpaD/CtpE
MRSLPILAAAIVLASAVACSSSTDSSVHATPGENDTSTPTLLQALSPSTISMPYSTG